MKVTRKSTPNQSLISFSFIPPLSKKEISSISASIKYMVKIRSYIYIYINTNNKYLTLLPETRIQSSTNVKNLVKKNLLVKLKLFQTQYNFDYSTVTVFCKFTNRNG